MPAITCRQDLFDHGLLAAEHAGIAGTLVYERPAWTFAHKLKDCTVGAFTFFNAGGLTSLYRVHLGRYTQIGESSIIGPPEHPMDWFSSHPFAFGRPEHLPSMYQVPEFARLAPEAQSGPSYVDGVVNDTWIDHEAYIGAGSFVKRGVRVGIGACVGARSVVTRDIPAYAIAIGSPARVLRLRFSEAIVERLLALAWWQYDLAPWKTQVDWSQIEATLDFLEQQKADGRLQDLNPETWALTRSGDALTIERRAQSLFKTFDMEPPHDHG